MKITTQINDESVLRELGARLAAARLARNLTQAMLAEQAGVSKRTVERLESGAAAIQLPAFLRICRALGLLEQFNSFIPEPAPSPIAQLKLQGRKRQRASGKKALADTPQQKWVWGDKP